MVFIVSYMFRLLILGSCYTVHKRIGNIMKVYIKRNDSVKIATLLTFETFNWEYTFATACSLLSVTSRHWSVARRARRTFRNIVTSGHVISGQA